MIFPLLAHCLENKSKIAVSYNAFNKNSRTIVRAIKWLQHPRFDYNNLASLDIGLIIVEKSMKLTFQVQAVTSNRWITNSQQFINNSQSSILCGWGIDERNKVRGLRCIKFPSLDQSCFLNQNYSTEYSW